MNCDAMKMYFHFGYNEIILFDFFHISSVNGLVVAVVGCFFMSFVSESLKFYRDYLQKSMTIDNQYKNVPDDISDDLIDSDNCAADIKRVKWKNTISTKEHSVLTLLYMVQVILSYSLMMMMRYNVWLCTAVIIGHVVGYAAFGWRQRE